MKAALVRKKIGGQYGVCVYTIGKVEMIFFFGKIDANRLNTEIQLNLQSLMTIEENSSLGKHKRLHMCMRYVEYWRTLFHNAFPHMLIIEQHSEC